MPLYFLKVKDHLAIAVNRILAPYKIGNTDVFEECLLKRAGVKTHPTFCHVVKTGAAAKSGETSSLFALAIGGLSDVDAETFAGLLKKSGIALVEWRFRQDRHLFDMPHTVKTNDILLEQFQMEFERMEKEDSAALKAYQAIARRKPGGSKQEEGIWITGSNLTTALNLHLKDYAINVHATDVFEETLLKKAGIQTSPAFCQFCVTGETEQSQPEQSQRIVFQIRGISDAEARQFADFLAETREGDVEFGEVSTDDSPFSNPGTDPGNLYSFKSDYSQELGSRLLDHFKEEFQRNILQDKKAMKKYRELSRREQKNESASVREPEPGILSRVLSVFKPASKGADQDEVFVSARQFNK